MLAWFRTFCEEGVANFFVVILSTVSQVFNECKCLFSIDQQWDHPIKKKGRLSGLSGGIFRSKGGRNDNPTVKEFCDDSVIESTKDSSTPLFVVIVQRGERREELKWTIHL